MKKTQPSLQEYKQQYIEINLLGRGNYGSAYLVESTKSKQKYVAKKIMMDGLSVKETEAAWGEIQILQKVSHKENIKTSPFIVEYHQCFHFDNTLIIIMEYCECGDLTTFLKNWKKKGEPLNEILIRFWFIQILFGVEFLHNKGILHRDLKSANIFLTSNCTIKIGDFGISKILDHTSAKTFVGTPYYLSPEVCENRPYDFKSDLWSLGCILYEMCTFQYPFQASNLLGLAMKILNQKVAPISTLYSHQLNDIVMRLLTKSQKQRVQIAQIRTMPYIKNNLANFQQQRQIVRKLITFNTKKVSMNSIKVIEEKEKEQIETNQSTLNQDTMKTINSQLQITSKKDNNEDTMKTINSKFQNTSKNDTLTFTKTNQLIQEKPKVTKQISPDKLTPKERLILKKQKEAEQKQNQLKQAVLNSYQERNFARQKKQEDLGRSGSYTKTTKIDLQIKTQTHNQKIAQLKKANTQEMQKNQTINLQKLNQIIQQNQNAGKISQAQFQDVPLPYLQQFISIPQHQIQQSYVNQQIGEDQEYENEEFQQYNDTYEETIKLTPEQQYELKKIQGIFAFETQSKGSPTKSSLSSMGEKVANMKATKAEITKKKCIQVFGDKKFKQIYEAIKKSSFDFKNIKKYTKGEQQLLYAMEEVVYNQR